MVRVFKSEDNDLSDSRGDGMRSDCAGSSISGGLFNFWPVWGGAFATRREAILQSSLNKIMVGVAANEVPGWTE